MDHHISTTRVPITNTQISKQQEKRTEQNDTMTFEITLQNQKIQEIGNFWTLQGYKSGLTC